MKKYYLHNGTESSGPFDLEELKAIKITAKTPVWFEGMLHWKTAGEIPELNRLFAVNPPPFSPFVTPKTEPKVETEKLPRKIFGVSQGTFFITLVTIIILVGITVLNNIQENRSRELRIKNEKTEIENYRLELKQKQQEEEKIQAVIQEKIDAERKARELKQNANNRISEIEQLLVENQNNIDETEKKLEISSDFKLLRSATEKKDQMNLLQKNIDSIKSVMNALKKESDQLKLDLAKLPK